MSAEVDTEMQEHFAAVESLVDDMNKVFTDTDVRVVLTAVEQAYTSALIQFLELVDVDVAERKELLKQIITRTAMTVDEATSLDDEDAPAVLVPESKIILKS